MMIEKYKRLVKSRPLLYWVFARRHEDAKFPMPLSVLATVCQVSLCVSIFMEAVCCLWVRGGRQKRCR